DTAAPGSTADTLQRRPQSRVVRQIRIGSQIRPRRSTRQHSRSLLRSELHLLFANQIDAPLQPIAVDDNADAVAITDLADRPARQRFRPDVADAGPRRDAGEASIGEERDVL